MHPGKKSHLWSYVAQVERVVHGFLAPLVVRCCGQVTPVEPAPLVVGIGRSVENMNAANE